MMDLTALAATVLAGVAVIITRYLIPFVRAQAEKLRLEDILTQVRVFVQAAEQLMELGSEKLEYVMEAMETWLSARKYTIDYDRLRAMVESEVYAMNAAMGKKPGKTPDTTPAGDATPAPAETPAGGKATAPAGEESDPEETDTPSENGWSFFLTDGENVYVTGDMVSAPERAQASKQGVSGPFVEGNTDIPPSPAKPVTGPENGATEGDSGATGDPAGDNPAETPDTPAGENAPADAPAETDTPQDGTQGETGKAVPDNTPDAPLFETGETEQARKTGSESVPAGGNTEIPPREGTHENGPENGLPVDAGKPTVPEGGASDMKPVGP